ncbi:hypothetical protein ACH33_08460 [Aneurinibacillus sp. XH2]|uniref:PucR family transcriptional regulator n=1 Tax=Aneurinibacillus sp. XH2 TaxID=1450761 RepID=UPI00070F15F9|nr:PucR family transcriptional regulator [Aneurinibacillus sp. XH2]AMA72884.1 hypothetical protein ACH33_08460 [Aneurinibacillus sp. XH2]
MHSEFILTVNDVLKRPLFQEARIIAGKHGLHRRIRWVHILETSHFDTLIHGEEMILATGIGFQSDGQRFASYLQKLIDANVSCLCLEIGQYVESVPDEMIKLANKHNFPLIIFLKTVRFVDITQDLHPLIINRHYQMLQKLESVSREFHRLSLTSQGALNVLKLLHDSTKTQIVYLPTQGKPVFIPTLEPIAQNDWLTFLYGHLQKLCQHPFNLSSYRLKKEDKTMLLQPVGAMGQVWALIAMASKQEPSEYHDLLLDSASLSIAQDLLRKRYMEERKLHAENLWVNDLLHNRLNEEEHIKTLIGPDYNKLNKMNYWVCLFEIEHIPNEKESISEESLESIGFHLSLLLRSAFEQHAFRPFITLKNNQLVVMALDLTSFGQSKKKLQTKERLQQVLDYIKEANANQKIGHFHLRIGVGQSYRQFKNAHLSYQEATQALLLYPYYQKPLIFYDELGVFQLLIHLQEGNILESFVHRYLGPLIEEDRLKGSDLLYTLKVYLENNGSKKLASEKLYIVRQSLYYRLEKIKELLGQDFMSPENQLALQLALRAYKLLYPDNQAISQHSRHMKKRN